MNIGNFIKTPAFFIFTHIEHHKILRTMGGVLSSEQSKKIISAKFFFLEWYVMNQKSFAVGKGKAGAWSQVSRSYA